MVNPTLNADAPPHAHHRAPRGQIVEHPWTTWEPRLAWVAIGLLMFASLIAFKTGPEPVKTSALVVQGARLVAYYLLVITFVRVAFHERASVYLRGGAMIATGALLMATFD
jgi:hypothetical protein